MRAGGRERADADAAFVDRAGNGLDLRPGRDDVAVRRTDFLNGDALDPLAAGVAQRPQPVARWRDERSG
jgi:hypothetical protein